MAVLYPINFNSSYTRWATTANGTNNKRSGTAMFYGNSFRQAGWLAVFKNTTKNQIKITSVNAQIGSAQNAGITADFICKRIGASAPGSSFKLDSNAIIGAKTVPVCNTISTTPTKAAVPDGTVIINPGEYFVAGCISKHHPWGYFNLALNRSSSDLPKADRCYYAQHTSSGNTSWTRVGSDGTPWKKHYLHITVNYENNIIPIDIEDKKTREFWQGEHVTIPVVTDYSDWTYKLSNSDYFSARKDGKKLIIESNGYYTEDKNMTLTVYGYNSSASVKVKSKCPQITSVSLDKSTLRPTETAQVSVKSLGKTNGLTYSIESQDYLTISSSGKVTAEHRTDSNPAKKYTITVKAKSNSAIQKTIDITAAHWTVNDIRIQLSSDKITSDSTAPDDSVVQGSAITVSNESTNSKLSFALQMNAGSRLSFDNNTKIVSTVSLSKNEKTRIYHIGNFTGTSNDEFLFAYIDTHIEQDTQIKSQFRLQIFPQRQWALIYPRCAKLTRGGQVYYTNCPSIIDSAYNYQMLPVIAADSGDGENWELLLSNYPIYLQLPINSSFEPDIPRLSINYTSSDSNNIASSQFKFDYYINNSWESSESISDYVIDIGDTFVDGWTYSADEPTTYQDQILNPKAKTTCLVPQGTQYVRAHYLITCTKNSEITKIPLTLYYKVYAPNTVGTKHLQGQTFSTANSRSCIVNTLNAANAIFYEYGCLFEPIGDYDSNSSILFGTEEAPVYIANGPLNNIVEDTLSIQKVLTEFISANSQSQKPFRTPRTKIAVGQYIMADDGVSTLADATSNTFLYSSLRNEYTASPYNEIHSMITTMSAPGEKFGLVYNDSISLHNLYYVNSDTESQHRLIYKA